MNGTKLFYKLSSFIYYFKIYLINTYTERDREREKSIEREREREGEEKKREKMYIIYWIIKKNYFIN